MKTVLVTGANGFVGNHLVRELAEAGMDVIGVGGKQGTSEKSPYLKDYMVMDLLDAEAVKAIDFKAIDGVIHLAALSAAGPSFDSPMQYITTNIGLQTNLFEAALAQDAKPRFLIVSSGWLYDPDSPVPHDESAKVVSITPYAVSKIGQEQMAHYYASRGFDSIIARPFNHIGPGQNPGFLIPDLAKQVVDCEKGRSNEIMVGNLDTQRDYTDVRDVVRAYRLLLEKGVSSETYNVCSGRAISGTDILQGLIKAAGINPEIKQDPEKLRPSDNPVIYGNCDKLIKATGWEPEIPIETTLADVIEDWRGRFGKS